MSKPSSATNDNGRVYGGESAAERQARQRRQFMDAGLELFGTLGYRATTVRMLCKSAGLTDRYFYKNFADTEDLLAAIYTESLDHIQQVVLQVLERASGQAPPAGVIEAALDAFFEAFENARVARICWMEVLGVSQAITALYMQRIQQFASLLINVARGQIPQLNLADEEIHYTGIALVGAISQSAQQWLLSDYQAPRRALVEANARVLTASAAALADASAARS